MRPRSGSGPTMEQGVNRDRFPAWHLIASLLIYPVTILPGLNALVLLISSVCVGLDGWSWEGALNNLSMGLPAVAGIVALWFSTLTPIASIARSRWKFFLVTTGLMTGLILECLFVKAGIQNLSVRLPRTYLLALWVFGGPLLAGSVNLSLLIWARYRLTRRLITVPVRAVPPHHLAAGRNLRPVRLELYRPPPPTRWWVAPERFESRVDRD